MNTTAETNGEAPDVVSTEDHHARQQRVTTLISQVLGVIDVTDHSHQEADDGFVFRDDITLDAIGGALELVRTAHTALRGVNHHGIGPDFPSAEPEGLLFRPMGVTDCFPTDPVSIALTRAEGVLAVIVEGAPDGRLVTDTTQIHRALWAVTGILEEALTAITRVGHLDVPRIERSTGYHPPAGKPAPDATRSARG